MSSALDGEIRLVDDVACAFAGLVEEHARAKVAAPFRLALSGGETARACYRQLAATSGIDWASVECSVGDERCVPADDADANQKLFREALVDRVPVGAFHPLDCSDLSGYAELLRGAGPLDLVHLGLGRDGHTASLFPASPGLDAAPGEIVVESSDPSGRNPEERASFTFEQLSSSRLVVFTVTGAPKRQVLSRLLAGGDLPASRVSGKETIRLCDKEALGDLAGAGP